MDLGVSGLASGFDWRTLVDQLSAVERAPQQRMRTEQNRIDQRKNAYASIQTQLGVLRSRVTALKDPALFSSRTASVSDSTAATATAGSGAPLGQFAFAFQQLATSASQQGTANVGQSLSSTSDVSGVVLSGAGFAAAVTAGTVTVNGQQVAIATTDTLQNVFDNISAATGGSVTGSYNPATDKITLSSAGEIVLGSATDTSNFLGAARLYNNGTGTVASSAALGAVRPSATLNSANLATAVSDGGSGAGAFTINGVSISFSATGDSLQNVLDRINNSTAGVNASYDALNDRFTLTNKATGDVGVSVQDVTGNFLAATGLAGGTLNRGKNLIYQINGGSSLVSQSNTITSDSSGLAGLTVNALKEGATATVSVGTDTAKVKAAIQDFLTEYNKVQSVIDSSTASSTDAQGKVTAGILANDPEASDIASRLRSGAYGQTTGINPTLKSLADLGITSNGDNNNLAVGDETALDSALQSQLGQVQALFTDTSLGLATRMDAYLEKTIGDNGTLLDKQTNLGAQVTDIDKQVVDSERLVLANRQRLIDSFVAMETAQAKTKQQLEFLQQRFGSSTSG
ncbi:MAG: flagellar filament capping protein FliD [Limisphaerales bacterium]